jgi:hypothetical protein
MRPALENFFFVFVTAPVERKIGEQKKNLNSLICFLVNLNFFFLYSNLKIE